MPLWSQLWLMVWCKGQDAVFVTSIRLCELLQSTGQLKCKLRRMAGKQQGHYEYLCAAIQDALCKGSHR
jgi:hypothetical protein